MALIFPIERDLWESVDFGMERWFDLFDAFDFSDLVSSSSLFNLAYFVNGWSSPVLVANDLEWTSEAVVFSERVVKSDLVVSRELGELLADLCDFVDLLDALDLEDKDDFDDLEETSDLSELTELTDLAESWDLAVDRADFTEGTTLEARDEARDELEDFENVEELKENLDWVREPSSSDFKVSEDLDKFDICEDLDEFDDLEESRDEILADLDLDLDFSFCSFIAEVFCLFSLINLLVE